MQPSDCLVVQSLAISLLEGKKEVNRKTQREERIGEKERKKERRREPEVSSLTTGVD